MLGCNQEITVWCRKKEQKSGKEAKEAFARHVLPVKCRWKNCVERNVSNGTANVYNNVVIIVPYFDDKAGFDMFDIKEGDIAALGVYDINITGTSPYTAGEVKRLLAPDIATVNSVSYNFDVSERGTATPAACGRHPLHQGAKERNGMKGKHLRLTGN